MSEIRSKVPNYGHEKEGTWPPREPQGEKGFFWLDEEGNISDRPPERKYNLFGKAPYIVQDSIDGFIHQASGEWIESRARLRETDKACGTITTDKLLPPDPTWANEQREKRKRDKIEAHRKALNDLRTFGDGALPEERRHECKEMNAALSQRLGFDVSKKLRRKDGSWK